MDNTRRRTEPMTENLDATQAYLRNMFARNLAPIVAERFGANDTVALNEAFNDWTDGLCKDGDISEAAYNYVSRVDS